MWQCFSEQFRMGKTANTLSSLPGWGWKTSPWAMPITPLLFLGARMGFASTSQHNNPSVSTHLSLDKGFLSSMVSFPNPRVHKGNSSLVLPSGRTKFSLLLPHFVQFTVPCCRTVLRLLAPQVIYSSLALLFSTNKKPIASYAYGHFLQIFCRKKIVPALLLAPPPPPPPWMAVGLNYKEHFLNISSKMTFIIIFSLTFQKRNLLCKFPIAAVTNFHRPRRLKQHKFIILKF